MEGGLFLDVVVGQSPSVLQLFTGEDQPLLVRGDALLVLDLGLHVLDAIASLNLQGDGLAGQSLDEDLHTTSQSEDEMEGGLLLDVVVRQGPTVLQLLASEDQPLLVRGDSFFILNLSLYVLDTVAGFNLQGDGLAREGLHKDLHTTSQSEDEMEGGLLLDVVIGQSPTVLELLAGEDQPLLVRGDALLILDLGLHILDAIASLDLQGDGLTGKGFDKDLHTAPQSQDEMESGLLLNVIIGQGPTVLQLLASKDQPLLVRGDALLVLDLGLNILDAIASLDLQGDGLASEGLHEDLHTSPKPEDEMEGRLLLNVVIGQGPTVLELFASEDQPLLVRRD